jgi:hypothetical protein
MKNLQQKSIVLLVSGLVLVCNILSLLIPSPVQADVGVRPILPGGSNIQPEDETPIQMADEVITMNIRPANEADNAILQLNPDAYGLQFQPLWYSYISEVKADFTMNNPTTEDVSLTAWFPLASALENVNWEINPDEIVPRIASFQVSVDGNPIDYAVSELPNPKGAHKPPLPWASFPVSFLAGKESSIQVSYLLPLQTSVKGSELALYYIFQTGAGWAGPIRKAELILNLPYPASSETLRRMSTSILGLPYFNSDPQANLPFDGLMEGNQARWAWTDFEPGAQDDFSIWLVDPGKWKELETARAAVQANPMDGQTWLDLASIYRSLALKGYNYPSIFATSYLSPGFEAYQKAAELLPEHPEPHVGLAMLSLAAYMTDTNAPSEVMGLVQEELRIARELETAHPNLAEQADISSWMLEDSLYMYFDHITATAVSGATSTGWARETEAAALLSTPSETPSPEPSLTSTTLPSMTPEPLPSTPTIPVVTQPQSDAGTGLNMAIIIAAEVIILAIVAFLVYRRLLRKPG